MSGKKKERFCNCTSFMFRIPTDVADDVRFTEEEVRNACADPAFREKVSIAAPSLIEMMDRYIEHPEQLSEKKRAGLCASVMKYYARSKTRTTPFGLFSGVGIGSFGEEEHFGMRDAHFEKKVNPDAEWLYGYIGSLEKRYMERLCFQMNNACCIRGNRAALIYTTKKDTKEVSVRYTRVFAIIQDACREYRSFPEIFAAVKNEYADVPDETVRDYIAQLIGRQILISNLRPPFDCKDQLQYLMEQCGAAGLEEVCAGLSDIRKLCAAYERTAIGEGMTQYGALCGRMRRLYDAPFCVQVDTIVRGADVRLGSGTAAQIGRLAEFFTAAGGSPRNARTHLDEYREKFIEKYGMKREVPLLEMLDSGVGIGAPYGYQNPRNDFYEEQAASTPYNTRLKGYLIRKYERALADGTCIRLDPGEMEEYLETEIAEDELPVSMELYFNLRNEGGGQRLYLGAGCGADAAGKTFGRFSVLDEEVESVLLELNREEEARREKDTLLCEVSILPSVVRNGNVVRALSGRKKELTAYTGSSKEKEDCIRLSDILIGVEQNRFYARNGADLSRVIFEANNMYNPLMLPNAMRFLLEISAEGTRSWSQFPWKYVYADYRHVPQIRFEDIVIENEKWKVNLQELGAGKGQYGEFKKQFIIFVKTEHMPQKIWLTEADNRILLDLGEETALRIAYDEMKKNPAQDVVFERTEEGEHNVYDDGQPYATEIVVPLFRRMKKESAAPLPGRMCPASAAREEHMVYPFEEWLYFKLYCKEEREEELIAFAIPEICGRLRESLGVDSFFMRYADPKPHIRLRFHGRKERLYEAFPLIMDWCRKLAEDHRIGDLNLAVYERELERYGGVRLIGMAEQLFCEDSVVVEHILNRKRTGGAVWDAEEIAVISVLRYVTQFYDSLEEQLRFMEQNYHSTAYMCEFKEKKDRLLALCGLENDWKNLRESGEGEMLHRLLGKRDLLTAAYKKAIDAEQQGDAFKNDIAASVLHLHCNRLLGTDRETERKVMAFAESVLYAKKFIIRNGQKGGSHETDESAAG